LTEMQRQNQELLNRMDLMLNGRNTSSQQETPDDEEILTTRGEFRSFMAEEMAKQKQYEMQSQTQYEQGYIKTINKLGSDVSENEYKEIHDEMMKNHNVRYSDNPSDDAERNWLKAERAVLRKKMANPVKSNPIKGNQPKAPLGGSSGEVVVDKAKKMMKFDDATLAYMKERDISPEKAAKILGNAR